MTDVTEPLPLSAAQHGIWLGQQLDRSSAVYGTAECIALPHGTDRAQLARAVRQVLGEADVLHVRIDERDGVPWQRLTATRGVELACVELDSGRDALTELRRFAALDLSRPFELTRGPLFRSKIFYAGSACYWYLAAHHVALDGFGFVLIVQRAAEIYTALSGARAAKARWFGALESVLGEDRDYRASAELGRDREFWLRRFRDVVGIEPDMALTAAARAEVRPLSERAGFPSHAARRTQRSVSAGLRADLDRLARARGGSWADALLAVFSAYFQHQTGASRLVLGLPLMTRLGSASLRVPCMHMNIAPLCLLLDPADDLGARIERVVAERRALRPHARYRYEDLRRDLRQIGPKRRLFGPVVNIMPFDYGARFGAQRAELHNLSAGPVEDLSLGVHAGAEGQPLGLTFDANPHAYDEAALAAVADTLVALSARWAAEPRLSVLALGKEREAAERVALVGASAGMPILSGEALAEPAPDVLQRFAAQVASEPAAMALETLTDAHESYAVLSHQVRLLAAQLQDRGVRPGDIVGIALPRGVPVVHAILAVLHVGAAYLPLDPLGPRERLAAIVEDARPVLLITGVELVPRLPGGLGCALLELDALDAMAEPAVELVPLPAPAAVAPEQPAYVIYTSGSSGRPNGVVVSRGALAHFVSAALARYGFDRRERILQFAPLYFDASVEEIFLALCSGACLVLRDESMLQSMPAFLRACAAARISVLDLPTAFWHELSFALSEQQLALPASVRTVIIGGEAALPERVRRWQRRVGSSVRLLNTYGPTEATVVALTADLSAEREQPDQVPIGRPLPGVQAVVLGAAGELASSGEPGELYLLGPTLASGYLNRPELERTRFVRLEALPGGPRAYRTGDRVQRLDDGALAFVDRIDEELKISGQRIDPHEVEAVLLTHPVLRAAAVVVRRAADGNAQLWAYVVPRAADRAPAPLAAELRRHAEARLLAAAVPAQIVSLTALPMTPSGKVDRRALSERAARVARAEGGAPSSLEQQIVALWQELLGGVRLGPADDFFAHGAQSLQVIQAANRLSALLGREIPASLLFDHPSVESLARALAEDVPRTGKEQPLEPMRRDARLLDDAAPGAASLAFAQARVALLTGATGFVGTYLLCELLEQTRLRVVCLVRAEDDHAAALRLRAALGARGLSQRLLSERVQVLSADLARPRLGLSERGFQHLARECDVIYHAAASVSLARSYASVRGVNALGAAELLRLAMGPRQKPVHHLSTLAVASTGRAEPLLEQPVALHAGLRDGYTQSKWVAEGLMQEARGRGLPVSIYRLGRVVGPRSGRDVNADDLVWRTLRAGLALGALPDLPVCEPWTPVDEVAAAVVQLSRGERCAPIYHLAPEGLTRLSEVCDALRDEYALPSCTLVEFCALLRSAPDSLDKSVLGFFEAAAQTEALAPLVGIRRDNLLRDLAGGAGAFPEVEPALLRRYFAFCVESGLFPAPPARR